MLTREKYQVLLVFRCCKQCKAGWRPENKANVCVFIYQRSWIEVCHMHKWSVQHLSTKKKRWCIMYLNTHVLLSWWMYIAVH